MNYPTTNENFGGDASAKLLLRSAEEKIDGAEGGERGKAGPSN